MPQSMLVWADQNMNENIGEAFSAIVKHSREHTELVGEKAEATLVRCLVLKISTAIDDGFKTAEYLGLSDWMPKEDVQKYSDRTDNLKNAMNLVKGASTPTSPATPANCRSTSRAPTTTLGWTGSTRWVTAPRTSPSP